MRARSLVLSTALTGCVFPEAQLDEAIVPEGLYLWLMADDGAIADDSGRVSEWTDHAGSARHARQGTATLQPIAQADAIGDLPAIQFDGSDDELELPEGFDICNGFTFFAVVQPQASSDAPRTIFYVGNGGESDDLAVMGFNGEYVVELVDRMARLPAYVENTATLVQAVMHPSAGRLAIAVNAGDEDEEPDVPPPSCTPRTLNVIGRDDYGLRGRFAGLLGELLFYERPLSPTEIADVNDYLIVKWSCCSP